MKKLAHYLFAIGLAMTTSMAMGAKPLAPETINGAKTVSVEQAKELFYQKALMLDVRRPKGWDAGRIPGALNLEAKKALTMDALAQIATKDEAIVMYCNGPKCSRASIGVKKAVEWGYSNVYYFRDGLPAWQNAGFPVE